MIDRLDLQKLRDLPIEGVARHKALCPFHDDHHASLSFSVRRNTYRCFACGAHGGTIDLVMKRLNMGFRDACRWLGAPLQLPPIGGESESASQKASPIGGGWEGAAPFDASRYERFFEHPFLNDEARRFLAGAGSRHGKTGKECPGCRHPTTTASVGSWAFRTATWCAVPCPVSASRRAPGAASTTCPCSTC